MKYYEIIVAIILGVSGWIVGHWLNSRRDLKNKLVEVRVQTLFETYSKLESYVGKDVTQESIDELAIALAEIQVLGSNEQIGLAWNFYEEVKSQRELKDLQIGELLRSIRDSIRKDLSLIPCTKKIFHFRASVKSGNSVTT